MGRWRGRVAARCRRTRGGSTLLPAAPGSERKGDAVPHGQLLQLLSAAPGLSASIAEAPRAVQANVRLVQQTVEGRLTAAPLEGKARGDDITLTPPVAISAYQPEQAFRTSLPPSSPRRSLTSWQCTR